jgi:hypothetical protein
MTSLLSSIGNSFHKELIPSTLKYEQAVSIVKDIVWDKLSDHTVGEDFKD